jgi:thymidylate synthase
MDWPLYFAPSLALGKPGAGLAVCLLWTPQERVLPTLDPAHYAVVGNLYSRDGVSFLVRNLLARPSLRALLLCGKDLTGSGVALVALLRDGLDAEGRIIGEGTRLHPEIDHAALELLRRSITLHDHRDVARPERVAALVAAYACPARAWADAPLIFAYREPSAEALPAAEAGLLLRAPSVRAAYLRLLWHVLRLGQRTGTQQGSDQHEILDLLTIVSDEPADPARCSYAEWMPFSRASLGERLADGRYSGYLGQLLHAEGADGLSYTYARSTRWPRSPPSYARQARVGARLRRSGARPTTRPAPIRPASIWCRRACARGGCT